MTASVLAPIKAAPLCELPADVLRIAAGFATSSVEGFDAVLVKPGLDGEVIVLAAQPIRVAELRCEGTCQRPISLPIRALRTAMSRDRSAEQVVIVESEGMLSLRTFSATTTVAVSLPEAPAVSLSLPAVKAGPCEVAFNRDVLFGLLRDLGPVQTLNLEPFTTGMQITATAERFSLFALLAGIQTE